MAILSSDDFPAIRSAIDVSMGAAELADVVIASPNYLGLAELLIVKKDPLAATRTGADAQFIKIAAINLTASLLARAIPRVTSFSAIDIKYARGDDWDARADALLSSSDAQLDYVLFPNGADDAERPVGFALAGSGRSWQPSRRSAGVGR